MIGKISIPNGLGYILELKPKLSEPVLGLKEWAPADRPHLLSLIYYSFRIMVAIGFFFAGLMLLTVVQWLRGKLAPESISQQRWLLRGWLFAAPLGYIAVECGWIVRCVGRQPWAMYGEIRTADAASNLPPGNVLTTLTLFSAVYTLLFFAALYFGSRVIRQGPNLDLPIPGVESKPAVNVEPGEFVPNQRPVEAQQ